METIEALSNLNIPETIPFIVLSPTSNTLYNDVNITDEEDNRHNDPADSDSDFEPSQR